MAIVYLGKGFTGGACWHVTVPQWNRSRFHSSRGRWGRWSWYGWYPSPFGSFYSHLCFSSIMYRNSAPWLPTPTSCWGCASCRLHSTIPSLNIDPFTEFDTSLIMLASRFWSFFPHVINLSKSYNIFSISFLSFIHCPHKTFPGITSITIFATSHSCSDFSYQQIIFINETSKKIK